MFNLSTKQVRPNKLQAAIDRMTEENFKVDFPSLLPDQPVFLYELNGLGKIVQSSYHTNLLYCFQLGGSVGLSPHPTAWSDFLSLHGNRLGSCPPGLGCPQREHSETEKPSITSKN